MRIYSSSQRQRFDLIVVIIAILLFSGFMLFADLFEQLYAFLIIMLGVTTNYTLTYSSLMLLTVLLFLTYRRWRRSALIQTELEMILDDINPDAMVVIDKLDRILLCNKSVEKLFGYTEKELLRKHTDIIFTHNRGFSLQPYEIFNFVNHEGFSVWNVRGRRKQGDTFPVELIRGELKNSTNTVLWMKDITQRNLSRVFVENVPAAVFIKDDSQCVQYENRYMIDVMGEPKWSKNNDRGYIANYMAKIMMGDDNSNDPTELTVVEKTIRNKAGEDKIYRNHIFPIKREVQSDLVGAIAIDITENKITEERLKKSLREKEFLLREIHHRVNNNLQVIAGLLTLQINNLSDSLSINALMDCQNRIHAIATVHEFLHSEGDLEKIDFGQYIRNILDHLQNTYKKSAIFLAVNKVMLSVEQAVPCGLILNELITNSMKHAFVAERSMGAEQNEIRVSFEQTKEHILLTISDNGVGLSESIKLQTTDSLGLRLVRILLKQLGGKIEVEREGGTSFEIMFSC